MVGPDRAEADVERLVMARAAEARTASPWSGRSAHPAMPVPDPGPVRVQLERLRRRWWLVAAVGLVAFLGSVGSALLTPTTYTGRSALSVASETRAPEQDAYLAQAYSEYFNQESYQDRLAQRAGLLPGIGYNARTAATSPIVYVEATAQDEAEAVDAAARMADAFRDDVNASIGGAAGSLIADLQSQLNRAEQRLNTGLDVNREEAVALDAEIRSLQQRIVSLDVARTNELRTLQRQASVSSTAPSPVQDGFFGLAGGLVLGGALVLVLAAVGGRLATPYDVRDHTGLSTIGRVGGRGRRGDRSRDLKQLTNVLAMGDLSVPRVVVVTAAEEIRDRCEIALAVATYRAQQGERTVLIRTSSAPGRESWAGPGVHEYLSAPSGAPLDAYLRGTDVPRLRIMPAGRPVADSFALFGPERVATLLGNVRLLADLVVVDAPSLIATPEASAICAASDGVVLVVHEEVTRGSVAATACSVLEQVHAPVLGSVLFGPPTGAPTDDLARIIIGPVPDQASPPAPPVDREPVERPASAVHDPTPTSIEEPLSASASIEADAAAEPERQSGPAWLSPVPRTSDEEVSVARDPVPGR